MSGRVCIDTMVMIWGVLKQAKTSQQNRIPLAVGFLKKCNEDKLTLVVPAVVVAELLAKIPPEERPRFQESISREFVVAPFDMAAAAHFAEVQYPIIKQRNDEKAGDALSKPTGAGERVCAKADAMIVATALASRCGVICSDDPHMKNLVGDKITLQGLDSAQIQASMLDLESMAPFALFGDDGLSDEV